ncbi:hypothetical protein NE865_03354 [Phthorimaea operculella]|nr:hypothetical protein NE865_03354 [Phthorimaea operculella]
MEILMKFQGLSWYKPDWSVPVLDKDSEDLIKQCQDLPKIELTEDVHEIIRKSKEFPIEFPIQTIRIENLKQRRPVERLQKNIQSTYPLVHEKVLQLMAEFLAHKRQWGTRIEKDLYKNMSVAHLIDRILRMRAATFWCANDRYKLLNGRTGQSGWEQVGTIQQKPPLLLEHCLSYDEMKLSSMVYVSGYTECINDGARFNKGVVKEDDIEKHAVIIGIIGPRFKRKNRMEYEDAVLTESQNTEQNGYGEKAHDTPNAKTMWRKIWDDFYQIQSCTYAELKSKITIVEKPENLRYKDKYVKIPRSTNIFHNEVYYKRICITAECVLLEAQARAETEGKQAFLNVIGAGLGVWRATPHQNDVYVLTFLDRVIALSEKNLLNHVSDVNLAYIDVNDEILELFTDKTGCSGEPGLKHIFIKNENHPRGGINFQLESREPSAKLTGDHEGKLLVMTYAWDGNAHPGNEFWVGKLHSSGDSAAACSTQVSELHNAHINGAVSALNTRIVTTNGLAAIQAYYILVGKLHSSGDSAAACSTQVSELHNAHINGAVTALNTKIVTTNGVATIQEYHKP